MDKTVLITGANRGIGLALVNHYLAQGDTVIAAVRKSSDELDALNVTVIEHIDVTDPSSVAQLASELNGKTIDVLINNAGLLQSMSFNDIDFESIQKQFEVNAMGPLRVVHALKANLKSGSKVALVTSRMGSIDDNTSGGSYGYRMSKTALNAAGKSLAVDLKDKGIAVALLHPGYVKTAMVNFGGQVEPSYAANGLAARIEALNLDNTGSFWHANGEFLPW